MEHVFLRVPGGRGGEAAALGVESGRALGCGGEGWRSGEVKVACVSALFSAGCCY